MPAKLTLHPPERAARFLVVRDGETLIVGRDPECGLVIEHARVSKRHARLAWDGSGWRIEDLDSKNGTSVNGASAAGTLLADGDWVSFGGIFGLFQRIGEAEAQEIRTESLARLETSLDLRRRLSAAEEPLDLLWRLLESARQVLAAERGFVLVAGPDGTLRAEVAAGFSREHLLDARFTGSVGAVERALRSRQSVVLSDVPADPDLGRRASVVEMGIGTLACVPLQREGEVLGLIYVDGRRRGGAFTELDLEILEALAEHAAVVLGTLRLDGRIRRLLQPARSADPAERELLDELQRKLEAAARGALAADPSSSC
jgi:pSer/pThr/pTyr-binding forkhead associated (FHA) protein